MLKNPIIKINEFGEGNYKKIIKQALNDDVKLFTLKNYDKKIVEYCDLFGKVVEDEFIYLTRLGEKILLKVCKYCRFLSVLDYRNSAKMQEKILDLNGLTINIENAIEKIEKKCDIIIDINKKINEEEYK